LGIAVSTDGMKTTHDQIRRPGSFEKNIEAAQQACPEKLFRKQKPDDEYLASFANIAKQVLEKPSAVIYKQSINDDYSILPETIILYKRKDCPFKLYEDNTSLKPSAKLDIALGK